MCDVNKFQSLGKMYKGFEVLYKFLVCKICNNLVSVASQFQGYLALMRDSGIPDEVCNLFENVLYPDDKLKFEALIDNITNHDLKWIHDRVEDLNAQMHVVSDGLWTDSSSFNILPPNQISIAKPTQFLQRIKDYQSYEAQLDALCDFMNFLVEKRDDLKYIIKDYPDTCRSMIEWGVPREVMDTYWKELGYPNGLQILGIISHIEKDYEKLTPVFQQINTALINVKGGFHRGPNPM